MITRRSLVAGFIAAPAVVRADSLMKVYSLPQRYATVWGVGHDLEVVEHVAWNAQGALNFAIYGGGIEKFREVTDIVYGFKMPPLPKPVTQPHWHSETVADPLARFRVPVNDRPDGSQTYFGLTFEERVAWCSKDPNDLWHPDRANLKDGFTRVMGYEEMNLWRESLRPDLDGRGSVEWIQEQIKAERAITKL